MDTEMVGVTAQRWGRVIEMIGQTEQRLATVIEMVGRTEQKQPRLDGGHGGVVACSACVQHWHLHAGIPRNDILHHVGVLFLCGNSDIGPGLTPACPMH